MQTTCWVINIKVIKSKECYITGKKLQGSLLYDLSEYLDQELAIYSFAIVIFFNQAHAGIEVKLFCVIFKLQSGSCCYESS